jgi:hypothetical protein
MHSILNVLVYIGLSKLNYILNSLDRVSFWPLTVCPEGEKSCVIRKSYVKRALVKGFADYHAVSLQNPLHLRTEVLTQSAAYKLQDLSRTGSISDKMKEFPSSSETLCISNSRLINNKTRIIFNT